jgi:hypothetical protein
MSHTSTNARNPSYHDRAKHQKVCPVSKSAVGKGQGTAGTIKVREVNDTCHGGSSVNEIQESNIPKMGVKKEDIP